MLRDRQINCQRVTWALHTGFGGWWFVLDSGAGQITVSARKAAHIFSTRIYNSNASEYKRKGEKKTRTRRTHEQSEATQIRHHQLNKIHANNSIFAQIKFLDGYIRNKCLPLILFKLANPNTMVANGEQPAIIKSSRIHLREHIMHVIVDRTQWFNTKYLHVAEISTWAVKARLTCELRQVRFIHMQRRRRGTSSCQSFVHVIAYLPLLLLLQAWVKRTYLFI